jgi:hypothetical protein
VVYLGGCLFCESDISFSVFAKYILENEARKHQKLPQKPPAPIKGRYERLLCSIWFFLPLFLLINPSILGGVGRGHPFRRTERCFDNLNRPKRFECQILNS